VFDLYLITPEQAPAEILAKTRALLHAAAPGRIGVQLRAKQLSPKQRWALAHALRALTLEYAAPLLINADVELAREVGADGAQLPENGPSVEDARAQLGHAAIIGASRHDLSGVQAAALAGASFATLSPVFSVPEKGEPLGVAGFAAIARQSALPLLALGGVTAASAPSLMRAGAHGVAVIRALFEGAEPARALHVLLSAIDEGKQAADPRERR
jgi:thiamine-phosphate pyrophosphorylase